MSAATVSDVPPVGTLARDDGVPEGAGELLRRAVGGGGPLLLDLGEPVAAEPAHLGLGEGRLAEGLGEQVCGRREVPLRDVDVDQETAVGHPGTEHHAVPLHQLGELLRRVAGRALVEQSGGHRRDALLAGRLGGERGRHDDAQRQDVLAGEVVHEHPHAVAEQVLVGDGEGPRAGRGDVGAGGAHATASSSVCSACSAPSLASPATR